MRSVKEEYPGYYCEEETHSSEEPTSTLEGHCIVHLVGEASIASVMRSVHRWRVTYSGNAPANTFRQKLCAARALDAYRW